MGPRSAGLPGRRPRRPRDDGVHPGHRVRLHPAGGDHGPWPRPPVRRPARPGRGPGHRLRHLQARQAHQHGPVLPDHRHRADGVRRRSAGRRRREHAGAGLAALPRPCAVEHQQLPVRGQLDRRPLPQPPRLRRPSDRAPGHGVGHLPGRRHHRVRDHGPPGPRRRRGCRPDQGGRPRRSATRWPPRYAPEAAASDVASGSPRSLAGPPGT